MLAVGSDVQFTVYCGEGSDGKLLISWRPGMEGEMERAGEERREGGRKGGMTQETGASPIFSGYTLSGTLLPTLTKAFSHVPLETFLHLKHNPFAL